METDFKHKDFTWGLKENHMGEVKREKTTYNGLRSEWKIMKCHHLGGPVFSTLCICG